DRLETLLLGEIWRLIARLGFAPSLDQCIDCGRPTPPGCPVRFDYAAGGVRCEACAAGSPGRDLPSHAHADLRAYLRGEHVVPARTPAHWQLLRRHLEHHVVDTRLKAFDFLEQTLHDGSSAPPAPPSAGGSSSS